MRRDLATKRKDKQIRLAAAKGEYRDPARTLGTSVKSKRRRARRLSRDKSKDNKTVAKVASKKHLATSYTPEDNPTAKMRTRAERMSIMFFALQTSVEEASEEYGTHRDTIYRWFKEEGGLAEVRAYIASKVETSLHNTIDFFLKDLPRRLETLDDETYFDTFQSLLQSAEKAGLFRDRGPGMSSGVPGGGGGSSGNSPEETQGNPIHFHITAPPASASEEPQPPEVKAKENPSVFDE